MSYNEKFYSCVDRKGKDWDNDKEKYMDNDTDNCYAPKKILLECGCNPQDAIFEIDDERVENNQEFVLDSVIVNTTYLCRPIVKIEFSSLIYFEVEAENSGCDREIEVDLLFELIKICKGNKECVQSWRYLKEYEIESDDELEIEVSEPFTVTFCDRTCPDCCEYKMIVKGKDFEGEFEALRVVKPNLSALTQGLCHK